MNRLQKKCFIGAIGLHLVLLLVLLVGPGFLTARNKADHSPPLEVVPDILTDGPSGGGNPNAKPPAPRPPPPPTIPTPRTPPQDKPAQKPEPAKEPLRETKPNPKALEPKPESKTRKPVINLKPVVRSKPPNASKMSVLDTSAQERARADQLKRFADAARNIRSELSASTSVEMPGTGGGPVYASYAREVQRVYKLKYDQALEAAGDIADRQTLVEASVTIRSDGTVASAKIVQSSGNVALDKLTKRVLDAVTFIAPFPEGAKDSQRTFNIIFDLKPRKALG